MVAPSNSFRNGHVGVSYALIHRFGLPFAQNPSKNRAASLLQVAKNLVQFTCSGKFLLERARSQVAAKLLERLDQLAQSTIQIVAVRENNITPDGIGTSRQAKRVTQAAARERHRQSGLIGLIAHHAGERDGEKLRKMRDNRRGTVMRLGIQPDGLRAQFFLAAPQIR